MGRRWAWVGMLGLCAWLSGCKEREARDTTVGGGRSAASLQVAGVVASSGDTGVTTPGGPPRGASGEVKSQGVAAPSSDPAGSARVTQAPAGGANTGSMAGTGGASTSGTPAMPTPPGAPAQPAGGLGRVMIGTAAVQARDDEAWFEGAAKAAQAARPEVSTSRALENVVIASSAVSGRVTRVGRDTITVRDSEGSDYVLALDDRSQGLRQGRRVSLRGLQEGTPVRAGFVLMGGRSVAREVRIRR
ncbi:hypothetical protein LZ198_25100 [Myxococcus sp. K15C18031901]|uniref:hypothetical protein n=1 Tax=Myxococcus dinghuensis TaxID=2906761 RepID=UPI0020A6FB6A|nr:hypothetical protein [Myxococcus dinghuensis]MCP3102151.1 hypothetical protein [Myxococcus dinghuensis]